MYKFIRIFLQQSFHVSIRGIWPAIISTIMRVLVLSDVIIYLVTR